MKFKKLIAKSLALSIIFLNSSVNLINSFANTSFDTRYESFQGNSFSVDNLIEGVDTDFEVEGNTMINVFDYSKMSPLTSTPNNLGFSINNKEITRDYTMTLGNSSNTSLDSIENIIQNGETYTFVLDVTKNTMDNGVEIFPHILIFTEWFKGNVNVNQGYTGKVIISFKAKTDYQVRLLYRHFDHTKTGSISISNIMLLKGDYYNDFTTGSMKIPKYFEGAKSVGEDKGKIEIVSENKNLLDINSLKTMNYSYDLPFNDESLNTVFNVNKNIISYSTTYRWNVGVGGIYKVKKNTLYTAKYEEATCDKNYGMSVNIIGLYENELDNKYWYTANYQNYTSRLKTIKREHVEQNVSLIYDSKDYDYLVFYIGGRWENNPTETRTITLKNVGIYETGNSNIEYERYDSNKGEILLSEPLRGIPGGAKDKTIKKNGKWYIERNVGCATIDGSEAWRQTVSNNGIKFFEESTGLNNKHYHKASSRVLLSDKLLNKKIYLAMTMSEYKDYIVTLDLYDTELWRIATTQDMTLSEFKSWLSINKPKVYYELETPTYEYIGEDLSIYLYQEMSYISDISNIPANIKITVDRILNRVLESIKIFKDNPTIDNLSQARRWINLMDESILKDEFQDNINSVTEVSDVTLERKTVSANLDLYIKSENLLSLSLDTNSVSFDDYSGIEDMGKKGAVNITVNSSLPYRLNAYLPEEIVNADKSKAMNLDILNIKEGSEDNYKTFMNTDDKVILKDDCSSGNNLYHSVDIKLASNKAYKADVYKTVIKFEVEQK